MFDSLTIARQLTDAGIDRGHADALADATVPGAAALLSACTVKTVALNLISAVIGGLVLALLFFLMKEKICPLPEIVGRWYFDLHTENTAYRAYQGMRLRYVAMLWREGHVVHGTVEKIHEKSSTLEKDYVGPDRTRGEVRGYIEKNYLGRDRLFLHIVETGTTRKSSFFHELTLTSRRCMNGRFASTIADQDGSVSWQRDPSPHS